MLRVPGDASRSHPGDAPPVPQRLTNPSRQGVGNPIKDRRHIAIWTLSCEMSGISPGEFADPFARAVNIHPLGNISSIREHHVGDRVGLDIFHPILGQRQFLIAPDRALHEDSIRRSNPNL